MNKIQLKKIQAGSYEFTCHNGHLHAVVRNEAEGYFDKMEDRYIPKGCWWDVMIQDSYGWVINHTESRLKDVRTMNSEYMDKWVCR